MKKLQMVMNISIHTRNIFIWKHFFVIPYLDFAANSQLQRGELAPVLIPPT